MPVTLDELEQRTRRLALILSNLLHIPVEQILDYAEGETLNEKMDKFVDNTASEGLKDFEPEMKPKDEEDPKDDPPPEDPPQDPEPPEDEP